MSAATVLADVDGRALEALLLRHLDAGNRMMAHAARRPVLGHRFRDVARQHRRIARTVAAELAQRGQQSSEAASDG